MFGLGLEEDLLEVRLEVVVFGLNEGFAEEELGKGGRVMKCDLRRRMRCGERVRSVPFRSCIGMLSWNGERM